MSKRTFARKNVLKSGACIILASLTIAIAPLSYGDITGETVVYGNVQFIRNGNKLFIHASDGSIINYSSFNIGRDQLVRFYQPSADSRVLNRILGAAPTQIEGRLLANGIVYIVNPAGVIFTQDAVVNVGGLYAAASNISNTRFLSGVNRFSDIAGNVENHGLIKGDAIHLIGRHVANHGDIRAPGGIVTMLAGNDVYIGNVGGNIMIRVDGRVLTNNSAPSAGGAAPDLSAVAGVSNTGTINAGGGSAYLGAGDLYSLAIHNRGTIAARGGDIRLTAKDGVVFNEGTISTSVTSGQAGRIIVRAPSVVNSGSIVANAREGRAGSVEVTSQNHTYLVDGSRISASGGSGDADGGQVLVHSYNGQTFFAKGAVIDVAGGTQGGTGGFAEVSGERIVFAGRVRLLGKQGAQAGTLLIDPLDITIVEIGANDGDLNPGGINFDEPDAVTSVTISASALEAIVGQIILEAVRDIFVNFTLDLTGNNNNITLRAGRHIEINAPILGANHLTLQADAGFLGFPSDGVGNILITVPSIIISGDGLLEAVNITVQGNLTGNQWTFTGPVTFTGAGDQTVSATTSIVAQALLSKTSTGNLALSGASLDLAGLNVDEGTLTLDGVALITGDVTARDGIAINDNAVIVGNLASSEGSIAFGGTANITGDVDADIDATFAGAADIDGTVTAGNNVLFSSTSIVTGDVTATAGSATFTGDAQVDGSVTAGTDVTFDNDATIGGDVTAGDNVTVGGNADITGDVTATTGTVDVTGNLAANSVLAGNNILVGGTTDVANDVTATAGEINLTGDAVIGGSVSAGTDVTFGNDATVGGDVTAGDNVTVGGNADITGNVTATTGTVDVTGNLNANSVLAGTNVLVGGTTDVANDVTATAGEVNLTGDAQVGGNVTAGTDVTFGNDATIGGDVTATTGNVDVTGDLNANSVLAGTSVLVGGTTDVTNDVTATAGEVNLTGTAVIGGNVAAGTDVTFGNDATIGGDVTAGDNVLVGGNADITGAVTATTGNVDITGNLAANSVSAGTSVLVGGTTDVTNDVTATAGEVNLTGTAVIGGDVAAGTNSTFGAAATLGGDLTAGNTVTFQNTVIFNGAGVQTVNAGSIIAQSTLNAGNLTLSAGSIDLNGAVTTTGNLILDGAAAIAGNMQIGGNLTFNQSAVFDGALAQAINVGGTLLADGDLTKAVGNLALTGTLLDLRGDVTVSSGALTLTGLTNLLGNLASRGDLTLNNNLILTAAGAQSLTSTTGSIFANGTIVKNTGDLTLGAAVLIALNQNVNVGGVLNLNGTTEVAANLTTGGDLVLGGSTTLVGAGAQTLTSTGGSIIINTSLTKALGDLFLNANNLVDINAAINVLAGNFTSSGGAFDNTGGVITAQNITIEHTGSVLIGANLLSSGTVDIHAGQSGTGDLTFGLGAGLVRGDVITLRAGDGVGGVATAQVIFLNAPAFQAVGGGSPLAFTWRQDASIDTLNGPAAGSFTNALLTLQSDEGSVTISNAAAVNGNDLRLFALNNINLNTALNLDSLEATAGGLINFNAGTITTLNGQTYDGAAVLGGNTTLASTANGAIRFVQTLGGNFALIVNTGGDTIFDGAVNIGSLTTDAGGTTRINGGSITTANAQTYNDAVILGGNTTLASTGSGNIRFVQTLGGNFALIVNTGGDTIFDGAVNIGSLTTDAGGTTRINGGTITTANAQTYNDAVILGGNTTLASTGSGNIRFVQTLGGNFALIVNTGGDTIFDGAVNIGSLTTDAGGATRINGGIITTANAQTYNDAVILGNNAALASTNGGDIRFNATLSGGFSLDITTSGITRFNDTVNIGSLLTQGGGITQVNTAVVTTTGDQTYDQNVEVLTDAAFTSTGAGDLTFGGTLTGPSAVTTSTDGTTRFNNTVNVGSLTTSGAGTTQVNGGSITTAGDQTYNTAIQLGADGTFLSTGGGDILFGQTVDGPFALIVNTSGITQFDGAVSVASILTDAGGLTRINGGSIITTGAQTYGDNITLGANTTLQSTGNQAIAFDGTVSGLSNLIVNTGGDTIFNGAVNVQNLTTTGGGETILNANITGADINFEDAVRIAQALTINGVNVRFFAALDSETGELNPLTINGNLILDGAVGALDRLASLVVNGTVQVNGGLVRTSGAQTYNGVATLGANTQFTSTNGGNIAFGSAVNGLFAVTINTTGDTILNGAVNVASLATDAGGTTRLNGGSITTTNGQTYGDNVILGANTLLTSTGNGMVRFDGSVTGGFLLDLRTGGITRFNGAVNVGSLITDLGGTTQINGGSITTAQGQIFGDNVLLGANTLFTSTSGANIEFLRSVAGAFGLTLNTSGIARFNDTVNIGSLTTSQNGRTQINGGSITTTGAQLYRNLLELGGNTVLTSTGGGNIQFNTALSAPFDLTVNTAGLTRFQAGVNLRSLRTDAGGATHLNGGTVTTTNDMLFLDQVVLGQHTIMASANGGEIRFGNRLAGSAFNLTVNTSGATTFLGQTDLRSLTTDAPGLTQLGGHIRTTNGLTINDPIRLVGHSSLRDASGQTLTLRTTIDNAVGFGPFALLVESSGDLVILESIGGNRAIGNLTLATTDPGGRLIFRTPLIRTVGDILLNPNGRAEVPTSATIIAPDGSITFETSAGSFRMGHREKFTVFGTLNVNVLSGAGTSASLSDINTLGDMNITAPRIFLLTREGGFLLDRFGLLSTERDFGLDFVAGGVFRFSVEPERVGNFFGPLFANPTGTGDVNGTLRNYIVQAFGEAVTESLLLGQDLFTFLDLRSDGPTNANVSEALASALPRESETDDVPQETALGSTDLDRLQSLGIMARRLQANEYITNTRQGVALYNDSRGQIDERLFVTVNRLLNDRTRELLARFEQINPSMEFDAGTAIVQARRNDYVKLLLEQARNEFSGSDSGEQFDANGFRSHLAASETYGEALEYMDALDELIDEIRLLGLTDRELRESTTMLFIQITPNNLSIDDVEAVIRSRPAVSSTAQR